MICGIKIYDFAMNIWYDDKLYIRHWLVNGKITKEQI